MRPTRDKLQLQVGEYQRGEQQARFVKKEGVLTPQGMFVRTGTSDPFTPVRTAVKTNKTKQSDQCRRGCGGTGVPCVVGENVAWGGRCGKVWRPNRELPCGSAISVPGIEKWQTGAPTATRTWTSQQHRSQGPKTEASQVPVDGCG